MAQQNEKWYMQKGMRVPDHVTPGAPRREVAQEFYTNVIELGRLAKERYLADCKRGLQAFDQHEIDELDRNIAVCEAELAKFK